MWGLAWVIPFRTHGQAITGDTLVKVMQRDTLPDRVVSVNRILIIGNKVTQDRIIQRELSLKPGDTISTKRIENVLILDQRKIYNLRLFNTVTIRWLLLSANQIDLLVEVNERWYTFPVPIFELSDRNFNEWWENYNHDFKRINYGLRLYQYNFRGRNETLRFTAHLGFTRRFELNYRIPYIDRKQKHGLIFDFNYYEPKNLAYFTDDHKLIYEESNTTLRTGRKAGVTYTFRKSYYVTHSFNVLWTYNQVADTIVKLNPAYFGSSQTHQQFGTLNYTFNSEHRDVIAYPLKGYHFVLSIQKLGFPFNKKINLWEFNMNYARYFSLGNNYFLSNFSSVLLSSPNDQPYSLYSALGYKKQFVRGYEVYVIEGPKFYLNKTTFKKKLFSASWQFDNMPLEQFRYFPLAIYLKGYLDVGYVETYPYYQNYLPQPINTRLSNKFLVGSGIGLDIVMAYDGVFRFEYTLTREKTRGFFFHIKKEF